MILAIASGKGGTGKTTVATSLARLIVQRGRPVRLLDADVEAPNCHLLLGAAPGGSEPVYVPVPRFDTDRCTACGRCAEACRFNALACVAGRVLLAAELCHGCGACLDVCPVQAIDERPRPIGEIRRCNVDGLRLIEGRMHIGEPVAVPVIRQLRRIGHAEPGATTAVDAETRQDLLTIIDAPPGTACPMVAAVRGTDYVILVTEPTPFGLHDLRLARETVRQLELPAGVVINRGGQTEDELRRFCSEEQLDILTTIPDRREIAEAYAAGHPPYDASPEFAAAIDELADQVEARISRDPLTTSAGASGGGA